ncbi:MAG: hypothetical protein ACI9VS_000311 [Candidatus Binatia bacterium]|jgi:hypothetical protein
MKYQRILLTTLLPLIGIACSGEPQVKSDAPTESTTLTQAAPPAAEESKVAVTFSGGHETDPQDRGRPVLLIASALGVSPQVFRDAFSSVTPSRSGPPSHDEARANKRILLNALGKYGVTNDQLDEVSNFYRYRPQDGELWKHSPAQAEAIITDGKVTEIILTDPGYGYSSPPKVTLPGFPKLAIDISLKFGADLKKNGGVTSIGLSATN